MDSKLYPTSEKNSVKNEKILSKFFPFYISVKVSEMQGIAQNLSNKFGALPDGMTREFLV